MFVVAADDQLLRQRRVGGVAWRVDEYDPVTVTEVYTLASNEKKLGFLPTLAFVATSMLFVASGICCTQWYPPSATQSVANSEIPSHAKCARIVRKADYVVLELAMGSPSRSVHVLLRLDRVVNANEHSIRLFTERLMESQTFACDADNATCYDTVILSMGTPNADLARHVIAFEYANPTVEYYRSGVARSALNLDGEMYAAKGYRYWMTSTHVCFANDVLAPLADTEGALRGSVGVQGTVETTGGSLASIPLLSKSAVHVAYRAGECEQLLERVRVFPCEASKEVSYLAISDRLLYEVEPEQVRLRRDVVELGAACASTLASYRRPYNLYDVDCSNAYATCRTEPSLPFRRVADLQIRAHYLADGSAYFWFDDDETLGSLAGLSNNASAVQMSILRLLLLILASAVTWTRSDRETSCPRWLYRHCVKNANGISHSTSEPSPSILEDAFLGLAAAAARLSVVILNMSALVCDNQARVVVCQFAASVASILNWGARYVFVTPNLVDWVRGTDAAQRDWRDPLARFGGSMAVADASSAVLLAFSETPLLMTSATRFDDTARLLTGLLISLVVSQRCFFACACNALTYEALRHGKLTATGRFKALLLLAFLSWLIVTFAAAVALADLVVTPMAFSITRARVGNSSLLASALFLTFVVASLPRLVFTCVDLVRCLARDSKEHAKHAANNKPVARASLRV